MPCGHIQSSRSVIDFLLFLGTSDAMVLYSGEGSAAASRHVGFDIVQIHIEPNVSIKIAILEIAGIALLFAPDLAGRFQVAAKGGNAVLGKNRGEHAIARTRPRVK